MSRAWWHDTASAHAFADRGKGREWVCACGPCLVARKAGFAPPAPAPEPPKKLDQLKKLMAEERWPAALALAAKFPQLGDERAAITRGHEAGTRANFYRQIGKDPDELIRLGIEALKRRYTGC